MRALEIIINSTHDAMIAVDMQGIITLYNKEAEKLTGRYADNVVGMPVVEVVENTRLPIVQPCKMTLCPIVTSSPTVVAKPLSLNGPAWVAWTMLPS